MLFGFHEYRRSIAEHVSKQNRVFFTVLSLFITAILTVVAYGYFYSPAFTILSIASEESISPLPDNYTAPLEQTRTITSDRKQVIGFLPSWSIAQDARVYPEYLDQIIYFGIGIDQHGNLMKVDDKAQPLVEWSYLNSDYFKTLQDKSKKTKTKILVAIKNFDNTSIDTLIGNENYTNNAVTQLTKLVDDYDLDGINIDFEYFSDIETQTLQNYNRFLTTLSSKLKEIKSDSVLSVDVNATVVYRDNAYDMVKIGEVVDQVIIMGYDYHRATSIYAGSVAPIDAEREDPSIRQTINSLEGRVGREKLILGIPLYGYEWQTFSKEKNSRTMPDTGAIATYKRVRQLITGRDDVELNFDETSLTPWLTYNQNGLIKQIYYEDERSILEKIKFVQLNDLDGIALWALGYEGDYVEPWAIIKENIHNE
ncbi:hypothetical protein A3A93_04955 [Candidatus Roizmanbacteria bacterium RIFCSPLOWO2_01_FULL_38_12]|uniref:chitinase n=1 Tax=Candidatus Roizmanbacteria bacterium RIFCSPLOWO2_01_FULL_38_12 TaxID=1802061 RepID=A0A1F7J0S3_9BACT|nr:MAG: hypothetical protein A2861_03405 [Candidatus Roizmanbacteria bacterium RIFCSPHIGHO2_01_FULL_38_15]OGK36202.1 MAG: hypothetical protein A3F59_04515 [Candidatus Roizmanbacteria bacterium RIFCSPHIGHO2_12_FULL_38_13]OGK49183.1 MAG: hypothetical protein A3A93_04955 [Candidatus Roizmanbacteria bacterium RIFCSPLOWO2_01_FULL_38_12]